MMPGTPCPPQLKRLRSMTVVAETFDFPDLPISPVHEALIKELNLEEIEEASKTNVPAIDTPISSVKESSSQVASHGSAFPVSPIVSLPHSEALDKVARHFRSHHVFESDIQKFVKQCSDMERRHPNLTLCYSIEKPPAIQWFSAILLSLSLVEKNGEITSGIFNVYIGKVPKPEEND